MANVAMLGRLTGFSALAALAADVLLGPALMTLAVTNESRVSESAAALQDLR